MIMSICHWTCRAAAGTVALDRCPRIEREKPMPGWRAATLLPVRLRTVGMAVGILALPVIAAAAATAPPQPYVVEWVYKVKWGHADEFFDIFKKYQIPILDRLEQLGFVTQYTVYRPGLHTGEDERWDYTVLIVYKDQAASTHEGEIERQLFPDRATLRREENRRWELVDSHWDLPIHAIDPHAADQ